ncbi:hypothetical protein SDC9_112463 [bioreactor metagenome]|uniref:Uncharacterized protein n=1 Tax=bioreactor metagenome TaxID=1076179 RepID=A0A645BK16_9ZZZZ
MLLVDRGLGGVDIGLGLSEVVDRGLQRDGRVGGLLLGGCFCRLRGGQRGLCVRQFGLRLLENGIGRVELRLATSDVGLRSVDLVLNLGVLVVQLVSLDGGCSWPEQQRDGKPDSGKDLADALPAAPQ